MFYNNEAIRSLRELRDRQRNPPRLSQRLLSYLSPFSAFDNTLKTEDELKDIFLQTTSQMASGVSQLINDAISLRDDLRTISYILFEIRRLNLAEQNDNPQLNVLAALLAMVVHPKDFAEYQSHQKLLIDITSHFTMTMKLIEDSLRTLINMRSNLNYLKKVQFSPSVHWRDASLEGAVGIMSKAMKRLKSGQQRLGYMIQHPDSPPFSVVYATATVLSQPPPRTVTPGRIVSIP
jgi:hypothetical protein